MSSTDRLDWNDLHLLLVLEDTPRVSEAADRLGVDPTTLTRRLKRLEDRLDMPLAERIRGGVVLAPAARPLVDAARQMERQLDDLSPDPSRAALSGPLRVCLPDVLIADAAPVLAAFSAAHPGVALTAVTSHGGDAPVTQQTDIALRLTDAPPPGLAGRQVGALTLSAYARAPDPGGWLSWSSPGWQPRMDGWISGSDPGRPIALRASSFAALRDLCLAGAGAALLPDRLVRTDVAEGRLARLRDGWDLPLWLLAREETRRLPRVRKLMLALGAELTRALREG